MNRYSNIQLLHNPTAGDETHAAEHLISVLSEEGFPCRYSSTKDKEHLYVEPGTDLLIIAGGDGTVRKGIKLLLSDEWQDKKPDIAILPLGTANNTATSLGIKGEKQDIIRSWNNALLQSVDVGFVKVDKEKQFFIESIGYGAFPKLMTDMGKEYSPPNETPAESMIHSLQVLHDVVLTYKTKACTIEADGITHSGRFFMVEVMNNNYIGPNLLFSPYTTAGDGALDVLLLQDHEREMLADYISDKIKGINRPFEAELLRIRKGIKIYWEGGSVHIDDKYFPIPKGSTLKVELEPHFLHFLTPRKDEPLI